jgi:hypothetical protein
VAALNTLAIRGEYVLAAWTVCRANYLLAIGQVWGLRPIVLQLVVDKCAAGVDGVQGQLTSDWPGVGVTPITAAIRGGHLQRFEEVMRPGGREKKESDGHSRFRRPGREPGNTSNMVASTIVIDVPPLPLTEAEYKSYELKYFLRILTLYMS